MRSEAVDRAFVTACDQDPARVALIEAIGSLAATLDAWLIAEGVERKEQLEFLRDAGCEYIQGFFFSRPMEKERFAQMLRDAN